MVTTHLIISRKESEAIELTTSSGEKIVVNVEQIRGNRCKLGIVAPRTVKHRRTELEANNASN